MTGIIDGIKTMIPALTILILAWGLGGVCREMIGTGIFVKRLFCCVRPSFFSAGLRFFHGAEVEIREA